MPLAITFAKQLKSVVGYDIKRTLIEELKYFKDHTLEVSQNNFKAAKTLLFSNVIEDIKVATIYIITVPTQLL